MVSLLHRATIRRKKLQGKNIMAPLLHRAAITSKQTTRNRKETQKQYLSNSKQVNADAVAHNYTSQIAYMPLLTTGLSNSA